ncbi:hypothetical protein LJB98_04910 [Bacteroidales bacterium OttesenSCG-928-M11]|nr:hypothetical protein [Bacteroidales bacterium OttesenSCG-928-M11]
MKKILFILLAVVIGGMQTMSAKTWRVNNLDNSADFQDMDKAIETIAAGDTIYLEGSSNYYILSNAITKKVAIIGPGYFLEENPNTQVSKTPAQIRSTNATTGIVLLAAGISIEGVNLYHYTYVGADNITIKRCYMGNDISFTKQVNAVVNNATIIQNYVYGNKIDGNNIANNCIVTNNLSHGISFFNKSTIENNTIISTASTALSNNTGCSIKNNITTGTSYYNTNCDISNNSTATTSDYITQSTASTDGKYQIASTSALMTSGTNGSQIGAFGGSSPYVLSGLPSVPHIYEIDAPNTASKVSGLQVTIKVGTEK